MYCRTRSFSLNWSRGKSSFLGFFNIEVVCLFGTSLVLVGVSSVLESSSLRFLGLRWAPAPFQHRSAG